jgi:hypothetical protein
VSFLRGYLIVAWLALVAVTAHAVMVLGVEGGNVFLTDFAQPWRAQFNTDFMLHVLPVAAWILWREPSKPVGLLCAIGTMAGGLFTLLYLLVASFRAQGDVRQLLLGKHWKPATPA